MQKQMKRPKTRVVTAVILLLLTAAVWAALFLPNRQLQEEPMQSRLSESMDYDLYHGGLYVNSALCVLADGNAREDELAALCARVGAKVLPTGADMYLLSFDAAKNGSELDGLILWLEESPLVKAAFISNLTRSSFSAEAAAADGGGADVPWVESLCALWEEQRPVLIGAGALVVAVSILLPTVLGAVRAARRRDEP